MWLAEYKLWCKLWISLLVGLNTIVIIIARHPGDLERFIYGAPGRCSLNSFYKTRRGGSRTVAGDASTGLSIRSALNLAPGVGVYVG